MSSDTDNLDVAEKSHTVSAKGKGAGSGHKAKLHAEIPKTYQNVLAVK